MGDGVGCAECEDGCEEVVRGGVVGNDEGGVSAITQAVGRVGSRGHS